MAETHPKGRHVNLQSFLGNVQEPRNLTVRQSLSEEGQDLALAMGEFRKKSGSRDVIGNTPGRGAKAPLFISMPP
jgi:hypothetical protein